MFSRSDNSGATKDYHRATDARLGPVKPSGTTGKSLIVLNPGLSLNQRVPGSSPGAPTAGDAGTATSDIQQFKPTILRA